MRKTIVWLCLFTLLCGLFVSAQADVGTYYVKTANKGYLNLREAPSTTAKVLGHLDYGTAMSVILFNNGWAYVKVSKQYGWVLASNISATKPSSGGGGSSDYDSNVLKNSMFEGFHPVSYTVIVNPTRRTGFVNLRWAPSTAAKPMDIRYYGYELQVLQENNVWCQVYDAKAGISAFVMKEYLLTIGYGTGY